MSLINCGNAYTQPIPGCIETIVLDMGLTAATDYTIQFNFANESVLERTYETDGDGKITLNKNADLEGFWNEADGLVLFNVYPVDSCEPVTVIVCEVEYTDLVFDFKFIDTEATEIVFPCPCL